MGAATVSEGSGSGSGLEAVAVVGFGFGFEDVAVVVVTGELDSLVPIVTLLLSLAPCAPPPPPLHVLGVFTATPGVFNFFFCFALPFFKSY